MTGTRSNYDPYSPVAPAPSPPLPALQPGTGTRDCPHASPRTGQAVRSALKVRVRAPNSVVLVGDPGGEPPESLAGGLVSATSSCVAVGTLSEADGETMIRLIDAKDAGDLPTRLAFAGELETPSNRLTIASVFDETYLLRAPTRARRQPRRPNR